VPGSGAVKRFARPSQSAKLRILVAEDNPINQMMVVRMFESLGHLSTVAVNDRELLSMLKTGSFDLVFMDMQMPEMDGLTATREIRERERASGTHIPIVAMTAHAMKGDREHCLAAGVDAYIAKPVSRQIIAETIESILSAQKVLAPSTPQRQQQGSTCWNPRKVLENVEGDETLLRELLQIFMEECPKRLAMLEEAIQESDGERIENVAHTLKGELAYLGLSNAMEEARNLERMAHERSFHSSGDLFRRLKSELLTTTALMRDMLEQQPTPR
jgi:two-component system, sensor histidine kinase and response regulator